MFHNTFHILDDDILLCFIGISTFRVSFHLGFVSLGKCASYTWGNINKGIPGIHVLVVKLVSPFILIFYNLVNNSIFLEKC